MPMTADTFSRTRLHLLGRDWPAFQVCGYTGLVFAIALGIFVAGTTGLAVWVISVIAMAAMATFLVLAFASKIITGEEQLIYYHQEIAIMLVSALVTTLLHLPALPYMDITILGVGTFLAFGRIGCMMVGCCHGRPCHGSWRRGSWRHGSWPAIGPVRPGLRRPPVAGPPRRPYGARP